MGTTSHRAILSSGCLLSRPPVSLSAWKGVALSWRRPVMDPSAFDIRPVTSSDHDRAVINVMELLDRGLGSVKDLRGLRSTMRQVLHVVAWSDGQPVGFGFAGTWPGGESYPLLEALIGVGPNTPTQGHRVGSCRRVGLPAQPRLHRGRPRAPVRVGPGRRAPRSRELPAGVEIVTRAQRPDLVPGMYEVALEAGPDIPGSEGGPGSFEDWHAFEIERPNNLPENCFIAVHQDEVVGFATLQVSRATPPTTAPRW